MTQLQLERERAFEDLLQAERTMRGQVEISARELRQLLLELAVRFDGARLETMRRSDPTAPANWTVENWRDFFSSVSFMTGGWGSKGDPRVEQELKQQVEALKAEKQTLSGQLRESRQALEEEREKATAKAPASPVRRSSAPSIAPAKVEPANVPNEFTAPAPDLAAKLKEIAPQNPPAALGAVAGDGRRGGDYQRALLRYWMILYMIGQWGLSAKLEIEDVLSVAAGISAGSGSLRRILQDLDDRELVKVEKFEIGEPRSVLKLCRLTDEGRRLYHRMFDADPQESEWERLIRGREGQRSQECKLAVLLFAIHARKRGWATQVLPKMDGKAGPDLRIVQANETYHVSVEINTNQNTDGLHSLTEANGGKVALCAGTSEQRAKLVGECRLNKLNGLATDLENLIKEKYSGIGNETPLWLEIW